MNRSRLAELFGEGWPGAIGYAFVAWVFQVTGPLLILLNSARIGHLTPLEIENWIFAGYVVGGLMTLALSLKYRMPIAAAWSIPGCVLVGGFLAHHTQQQAIGVYVIAGFVALFLGVTGVFRKVLALVPMPIILGMVAGVLTPFLVDVVHTVKSSPTVVWPAIGAYIATSALPKVARRVPPILSSAVVGTIAAGLAGEMHWAGEAIRPVHLALPGIEFDLSSIAELLVPLLLTMLVAQDAQTLTILKARGFEPPTDSIISVTGIGTLLSAPFGSHSNCTAPVMTAILVADEVGPKELRYRSAVFKAVMTIPFAIFAPVSAAVAVAMPADLIRALGGLALLPVLSNLFVQGFGSGKFRIGTVSALAVTLAGTSFAGIGSPFWGLVAGCAVSLMLERQDFRRA